MEYLFLTMKNSETVSVMVSNEEDNSFSQKTFLLSNSTTPEEVIRLTYKHNPKSFKTLVTNPNTPSDLLFQGASDPANRTEWSEIAIHCNATDNVFHTFIENETVHWSVLLQILNNPNASHKITILASDRIEEIISDYSPTSKRFIRTSVLKSLQIPTREWANAYFAASEEYQGAQILQTLARRKRNEFTVTELKQFYIELLELDTDNVDDLPLEWLELLVRDTIYSPV